MPARALFTSASVAETWLRRVDGSDRNVHARGDGGGLGIFKVRLGALESDLIVGRIDFYQHRSRLHVLVVLHVELDDMSGDAGADGIDVAVDLSVVGGFIAGEVAIGEESRNHKHNDGDDDRDPKTRTLGARRRLRKSSSVAGSGLVLSADVRLRLYRR